MGVEELRNKCDEKEEEMCVYHSKEQDEAIVFPRCWKDTNRQITKDTTTTSQKGQSS